MVVHHLPDAQPVRGEHAARIRALEKGVKIWEVGRETAEVFGVLKAQLEGEGNRLDDFDLAIAALG